MEGNAGGDEYDPIEDYLDLDGGVGVPFFFVVPVEGKAGGDGNDPIEDSLDLDGGVVVIEIDSEPEERPPPPPPAKEEKKKVTRRKRKKEEPKAVAEEPPLPPIRPTYHYGTADIGPVNCVVLSIVYTPADAPTRGKKRKAFDAVDAPRLRPEKCIVESVLYMNLKGGRKVAYLEKDTFHVHRPMQYEPDTSLNDCITALEECIYDWSFLREHPTAPFYSEMQVDQLKGMKRSQYEMMQVRDINDPPGPIEEVTYTVKVPINYAISAAITAVIRSVDRYNNARAGMEKRQILQTAKKAGVLRGTQYSEDKRHKAASIAQARREMAIFGDLNALNFLHALEKAPHLKADDFADAYNMALHRARYPLKPSKRKKPPITQPGYVPVRRHSAPNHVVRTSTNVLLSPSRRRRPTSPTKQRERVGPFPCARPGARRPHLGHEPARGTPETKRKRHYNFV